MGWLKRIVLALFLIPFFSCSLEPDFEEIKAKFDKKEASCLQSVITVGGCDYKLMKSEKHVSDFMKQIYNIVFKNRFSFLMVKVDEKCGKYYSYSIIKDDDMNSVFFNFDYKERTVFIDIYSKNLYNPYVVGFLTLNWFKAIDLKFDVVIGDQSYEYKSKNRLKLYV